jgi:hypothetical protein
MAFTDNERLVGDIAKNQTSTWLIERTFSELIVQDTDWPQFEVK